ncbi:CBS domain-containing protein, partial [Candidatus Thorarchaeota archaeon]
KELAREVGVSQSYIARLETGDLDPKLSIVARIYEVLAGYSVRCSEIMTPNPVTVDARDSASDVVRIMLQKGFSQVPVVRGRSLVGMVTERDIIRNLNHDLDRLSVQAVMETMAPPQVDEATPISRILHLFDTFQAVLVVSGGRLTGIISRSDLLPIHKSSSGGRGGPNQS